MFRNALEPWHLVILVLVIVVVFGWKRLPDVSRSLGRSLRIFKSEVSEMQNDSSASKTTVPSDVVDEGRPAGWNKNAPAPTPAASAPAPSTAHATASAPRVTDGATAADVSAAAADDEVVINGVRYKRTPDTHA